MNANKDCRNRAATVMEGSYAPLTRLRVSRRGLPVPHPILDRLNWAESHMQLSIGDRLGPYEILAPIGTGGMGEVYKGRDTRLHREVAVKVLPETFVTDAARERFQREARAASALNHPNICAVYD